MGGGEAAPDDNLTALAIDGQVATCRGHTELSTRCLTSGHLLTAPHLRQARAASLSRRCASSETSGLLCHATRDAPPPPPTPTPFSSAVGLGDFVFYSVLVSRAALFDVSTFAATFVAVILGLGGTLFLLGVFKKALPALPISIFLGVVVYFVTRLAVTPFLAELSIAGAAL